MANAVALTFDVDGFAGWLSSLKARSLADFSRGEFEPIGTRRILGLLGEYDLQATFFVPGHTARTFPQLVSDIAAAGHEIAHHGDTHEDPVDLTLADERRLLDAGTRALESTVGARPVGYRAPSWAPSSHTVGLLVDAGFVYDSSLMGADFTPYWCRRGDDPLDGHAYRFGTPCELVELPVSYHLDDWAHFEPTTFEGGAALPGLAPPEAVLACWLGELDYMRSNEDGGVMVLTCHPQVIGRGYRLQLLRRFVERALDCGDVTFERCVDYAIRWREGRTPSLPPDAPHK